jgi:hypothetical protein
MKSPIKEHAVEESYLLQAKMIHIREQGIAEGDFTFRYKCALKVAKLAFSIGVLVSAGTLIAPVPLGASAIIAAYTAIGGVVFLKEGIHAIDEIAEVIETCFPRH